MAATAGRDPSAPVPPEITARVAEIMKRPYRKIISGGADEGYLIQVPDLPGCMTDGDTEAEAVANLPDAMMAWLESALLDGDPIPEPTIIPEYSGKVLVQMPKSLHQRLVERAEEEGVSASQLAVSLLSKGL